MESVARTIISDIEEGNVRSKRRKFCLTRDRTDGKLTETRVRISRKNRMIYDTTKI